MPSLLIKFLLALLLAAASVAGGAWWYAHQPLRMNQPVTEFVVERGAGMRQVARAVAAGGVAVQPELLYWIARLGGKADRIVAGSYEAAQGITPWELILKIHRGEVSQGVLLIPEGWTFAQMRAAVEVHPHLLRDSVGLDDAALLKAIGADEANLEGLFFPDTYRFDRYSSALEVFRAAHKAMQERLERAWRMRAEGTPLRSPYEALILASIIEKETARLDERGLVASVFANRLRIGMRLQTDPTLIYGLGDDLQGRLLRKHLQADGAYNTYTRAGLPPTPIALPGWGALEAAVRPPESEYYYFVARGDGTSEFSRNLKDHNRAVDRYQRGKGS
ncbi:MAG: endolytic transglycosylase MltG [Rhodocyclales bacterium]|nr:endolytic transglycosylase MltG [Rhodocyclales bacterium]